MKKISRNIALFIWFLFASITMEKTTRIAGISLSIATMLYISIHLILSLKQ